MPKTVTGRVGWEILKKVLKAIPKKHLAGVLVARGLRQALVRLGVQA